MPGPLEGFRVVELSTMITGPLTGMLLADLGAEVIKIENPEGGDPFRGYGGGTYSAQFCTYNRNKRSAAVSLKSESGRRFLERLVVKSDVLIENFRPGVLERLGFSDARLKELNPALIRCSITGFGKDGPYAARPCYDAIAQGLSGMSSQFLDQEKPRLAGTTISDNVTGQYACYGILSALLERERTGKARRVDVNMLDATMAFMPEPFAYLTQNGEIADAYLRVRNSQAYAFRCSDGKIIAVHMASQQKFWERFAKAVELPELIEHPSCLTLAGRVEHYDMILEKVGQSVAGQARIYWMERLERYDVPFTPVNSIPEVFEDPQVQHLDSFAKVTHKLQGELTILRRPVRFDGQRDDQPMMAPPTLGEHTEELMREFGFDPVS
ncbi:MULTISPECIES: CaiB/BaiF CoA-transferase family protein [Limibacillus]|jgi:formyl-CoA transferase|uniref:Formyl-CoA transferase n=1 Tax=Limibacillus halophilus TaxID=1579333 RepID=A0A839STI7_9PROT|nr:CaiB/BaiF CoA-transferase family protein [Limibacillus halophilus]MBB3064295.1 formyl-CoA transferase [Limibacillus halophilus]